MFTSRTAQRLAAILFLLAGLLLLKKPVFGQTASLVNTQHANQTTRLPRTAPPSSFALVITNPR
jgi:hypothetical protein